ncbi:MULTISPECIES: hypothetical protein [unclassified Kitasatospora]|uniref:hypothetical protein n=1 Tax=unclassified Kitasatospora TaxID=2633591 RepID=UPI0033CF06B4
MVTELNRLQGEHDEAERELTSAQQRLYVLWALSLMEHQPAAFRDRIRDELDSNIPHGAAGQVAALTSRRDGLREQIPWPTATEDLEAAAARYAADQGMRAGHTLQRVPREMFEQAADPVVLLQSSHLHAPMTRGSALPCRTADGTVTAVGTITAATVQSDVDKVNTAGLPEDIAIPALLTEFFILARARHTGTDLTGATGPLPAYGTEAWRRPWQPLYLMWEAEYVPLTYRDPDGTDRWHFDGSRYRWQGGTVPETPVILTGRQILTPTAGHDTDGKLAAYAAGRTDLPDGLIPALREELRSMDVLSQRLEGFTTGISQRDPRSTLRPTGPIADLIGNGDHETPYPGQASAFPGQPSTSSPFYELRSGQLAFTKLAVVDRFGRTVSKIGNPQHFRLCRPASMVPDHPVQSTDADRFVELAPRLLQPARLHFGFLNNTIDQPIDLTPAADPVWAWLLNNRLDKTLVCYAPDGHLWGELRTILQSGGSKAVIWAPLPGSPVATLDQLADIAGHAHRLLAEIRRGPAALDAFRGMLDDALATIDPDGPDDTSLGFLLGRPLALVRARLDLQLHGPARTSVGWNDILSPPAPDMPDWEWTVRLGQTTATDDGLVGYILGEDYAHFETAVEPADTAGDYLRHIGTGDRLKLAFHGTSTATATLLLDPGAAVHDHRHPPGGPRARPSAVHRPGTRPHGRLLPHRPPPRRHHPRPANRRPSPAGHRHRHLELDRTRRRRRHLAPDAHHHPRPRRPAARRPRDPHRLPRPERRRRRHPITPAPTRNTSMGTVNQTTTTTARTTGPADADGEATASSGEPWLFYSFTTVPDPVTITPPPPTAATRHRSPWPT